MSGTPSAPSTPRVEHTTLDVTVTRADDRSLGVDLAQDGEGRPTIEAVDAGGPCDRLLRPGDRIVAVEGAETSTVRQVVEELGRNTGSTLRLTLGSTSTPLVQPKLWSTSALTVAASRCLDVPLICDEPSLGSFSFTCADGGEIEFSLLSMPTGSTDLKAATPLVAGQQGEALGRGEGTFRVSAPCTVIARLDNSATYVSPVTLACVVSLAPIGQIVAAELASLEAAQAAQQAHLDALARHAEGLATQEAELASALAAVRVAKHAAGSVHAADTAHSLDLQAAAESLLALPAAAAAIAESPEKYRARAASRYMEQAEGMVGHGRRVRALALEARRSLAGRMAQAESAVGSQTEHDMRRQASASEAAMRADQMGPLLPLPEVQAAFTALAAKVCGAGVALATPPHAEAVYATSREDLFVVACAGLDLRDDGGARLATIPRSYCLLLQGRVVPLVGEGAGVLPSLDHFPDASDIVHAASLLDAEVLDLDDVDDAPGSLLLEDEVEAPSAAR